MSEMPKMGLPMRKVPPPPPDYEPVCIGYKCGEKLQAGKKGRHFCPVCWELIPLHLRAALKGEHDWLRAHGRTGVDDQTTLLLYTAASNRVLEAKLAADPKLREEYELGVLERLKTQAPPALAPLVKL